MSILAVTVLLSAVVVPLLNEGVIQTVWSYINGDIAYTWLSVILQYLIVIIQYISKYAAMAAVCVSLVSFGGKKSRTVISLLLIGSVTTYIVAQYGSWLFQYNNNLLDTSDILDVAEYAFNYTVFTIFDFVKSTVLVILCLIALKRIKKKNTALFIPDDTVKARCPNFKSFMRAALGKESVYRKFSFYCMWVMIAYDVILTLYGKTLPMLLTDGVPESLSDYSALASGYILIAPGNILGFFVMICVCLYLSFYKSKPRTEDNPL